MNNNPYLNEPNPNAHQHEGEGAGQRFEAPTAGYTHTEAGASHSEPSQFGAESPQSTENPWLRAAQNQHTGEPAGGQFGGDQPGANQYESAESGVQGYQAQNEYQSSENADEFDLDSTVNRGQLAAQGGQLAPYGEQPTQVLPSTPQHQYQVSAQQASGQQGYAAHNSAGPDYQPTVKLQDVQQQFAEHGQVPPHQGPAAPSASGAGAPVRSGGSFLDHVKCYGSSVLGMITGQPAQAFEKASRSSLLWLVGLIATSVAFALMIANLVGLSASGVDMFARSWPLSSSRGVTEFHFGRYLLMFFCFLVVTAVSVTVRALLLKVVAALRGVSLPVSWSISLVTLSYAWASAIAFFVGLVWIIRTPGFAIFGMFVATLVLPLGYLLGELLLYIGLNRTAVFKKSVVVPYVLLTGVAMVLTMVLGMLVFFIFNAN